MQSQQIHSLLQEATQAADPKLGVLYCYADLQDLLRKLATETGTLLLENHRLTGRLRRTPAAAAPPKSPQPAGHAL